MRLGQFRRDTEETWQEINPVIADGEFILVAPDSEHPKTYTYWKVGDGVSRYSELPYHQDATEDLRAYTVQGSKDPFDKNLIWYDVKAVHDGEDPDPANPAAKLEARTRVFKDGRWVVLTDPLKVDKEKGKGLSTNDFTDELKALLESILPKLGAANGIASLNDIGKVPAQQLPSYVDTIMSVDTLTSLPGIGSDGVIYSVRDTRLQYRWDGHMYVPLYNLALGETEQTAYAGNKGKKNADDIAALKKSKVDVIQGKSLSTNDFTDYLRLKLIELVYITELGGGFNYDADTGKLSVQGLEDGFNYNDLKNIPTLNNIKIQGDLTFEDVGLLAFLNNWGYSKEKLLTSQEITNKLSNYVMKEAGKGLSSNDFTNEYKESVDHLNEVIGESGSLQELESRITDAEGAITDNYEDIQNLKGTTSTLNTNYTNLEARVKSNEQNIKNLQSELSGVSASVTALEQASL